jgi:iron complex transport system substrate-binding protein
VHPEAMVAHVPVVGGTKTPNLNKILAASPDVVVLDREENPKAVYEALIDAGITVYASSVEHPNEVPKMLRELGTLVNRREAAERYATELEALLIELLQSPLPATRVAPMIWHEPLMSVGPEKYAGGLLTTLGLSVPSLVEGGNGYPVVTVEALKQHDIEALLLSSEPHRFALEEGEDIAAQVIAQGGQTMWCKCIDGEALTWFGTHTAEGLRLLHEALK